MRCDEVEATRAQLLAVYVMSNLQGDWLNVNILQDSSVLGGTVTFLVCYSIRSRSRIPSSVQAAFKPSAGTLSVASSATLSILPILSRS